MRHIEESSDIQLVNNIKLNNNTEKSLEVLIARHSGLCVDIISNTMSSKCHTNLKLELINERDYSIYQAALKYDENKGTKFSTYLGNEVKWKCLNAYNKSKKNRTIPVEEGLIDYFSHCTENAPIEKDDGVFNLIIHKASKHPDKRVGKIFHLRYVVGQNNSVMPWKHISKNIGMSIQGCINIHNLIIKNMKHRIKKEINE